MSSPINESIDSVISKSISSSGLDVALYLPVLKDAYTHLCNLYGENFKHIFIATSLDDNFDVQFKLANFIGEKILYEVKLDKKSVKSVDMIKLLRPKYVSASYSNYSPGIPTQKSHIDFLILLEERYYIDLSSSGTTCERSLIFFRDILSKTLGYGD